MDDPSAKSQGPLADLRVVEMGSLIAGPFCGQLLGDFGAEVIKLEDPGVGDAMRQWGRAKLEGQSLWWPVIARNKRCATLNLRDPDGQAIARDLIAKADIVVENFRPGSLEKWGLGYDVLSAINPGLILVRVSGYGQTGPYRDRTGFGAIAEGMGGLRYVTGDPDRAPVRPGISIGDTLAATYGALGALTALHARARTGRGQVVDAALYESVLAVMENLVTEYDKLGYVRERSGSILPGIAPSNVYPCADGAMVLIGGNNDAIFARLAEAMGRPELAASPDYATHDARGRNQARLDALIADWTATLPSAEVLALMHRHSVPAGPIYRAPDMLADPHFQAREAIIEVAHPQFGTLKMQGVIPKLSDTPGAVRWPGPALGEHNAEVYGDLLGYSAERIEALKIQGVI